MTVTVYHRDGSRWTRTAVEDAWARWNRGVSHGSFARGDESDSLILIPWREELELDPEDGIFPGYGPEVTPAPLKTQLPQVQIIREVALHRTGSLLDHWEVKAR